MVPEPENDDDDDDGLLFGDINATKEFESWKSQMRQGTECAIIEEEDDEDDDDDAHVGSRFIRSARNSTASFNGLNSPSPVKSLDFLSPLSYIQPHQRRRSSNHEELIWGTSPFMLPVNNNQRASKFEHIFRNSPPKSSVTPPRPVQANLSIPPSSSPGKSSLGSLSTSPAHHSAGTSAIQILNAPLASFGIPVSGQSPKFQSEYLKQITSFKSPT